MPIYTRRGDRGTTRLYGTRDAVSKTSRRVNALGGLDELSAQLGVVLVQCPDGRARRQLQRIQHDLFEIGAEIASPGSSSPFKLRKNATKRLESWIDYYWKNLPPLANFIFPGGSAGGAQAHVARTVCRRAERALVELSGVESLNPNILSYINRLSDFLLALARWINHKEGVGEEIWVSKKQKK